MVTALLLFMFFQADSVCTVVVESSAALFRKGTSMTVLADGMLAVVDQGNNTVNIISPANKITASVGGKGFGSDAFDLPSDISSSFLLDLYAVDQNNRRVLRFDNHLNIVQSIGEEQTGQRIGTFQPIASAVTLQGDLYVLERDHKRVAVFNSRGQFLRDFGALNGSRRILTDPRDIAISGNDEIFVLDRERVLRFDIFGNLLSQYDLVSETSPTAVALGNNSVIVTFPERIVIIPLDTTAPKVITRGSFLGEKVTDAFTDAYLSGATCLILTTKSVIRCILR
jgi:hypothetical protein